MVWKDNKRMGFQGLPFLEKLAHAGPLWYLMTEEQKNARIHYINKFYKGIKCKHCTIPEIE